MQLPNKPVYFKGLNMLIWLFTIYGIIYIAINPLSVKYSIPGISVASYSYLKNIYLSMLPIYPFYYIARKGYLSAGRLRKWGFFFGASAVISYFKMRQEAVEILLEKG